MSSREWRRRRAMIVLGGVVCSWPGCGNTTYKHLQIDHIHGDGKAHRKQLRQMGISLETWIIENEAIGRNKCRVLCGNHHLEHGHKGGAPIERAVVKEPLGLFAQEWQRREQYAQRVGDALKAVFDVLDEGIRDEAFRPHLAKNRSFYEHAARLLIQVALARNEVPHLDRAPTTSEMNTIQAEVERLKRLEASAYDEVNRVNALRRFLAGELYER